MVSDAGVHPLPGDVTVLDLVREGLPAAVTAGEIAYVSTYIAEWASDVFGSHPESAPGATK